jgi:hypothetical protein
MSLTLGLSFGAIRDTLPDVIIRGFLQTLVAHQSSKPFGKQYVPIESNSSYGWF